MMILDQQNGIYSNKQEDYHNQAVGGKKLSTTIDYDDTQLLKMVLLNGKAVNITND